jgi:hypothetical protein
MQSTLLGLPSGGTIDLTNFVAIVPIEQSDRHQIVFSGLSQPLTLVGVASPWRIELMRQPLKYFYQLKNL